MELLVEEAYTLVVDTERYESHAASRYWYGHIMSALGNDEYPTHATTMQNTIDNLKKSIDSTTSPCDDVTSKEQSND